jgi:hypothetical protein
MDTNDKALAWGNAVDGSVSGLVYHETSDGTKQIILGSVTLATTEKSDIRSITQWGNKLTAEQLREWADLIEPEESK